MSLLLVIYKIELSCTCSLFDCLRLIIKRLYGCESSILYMTSNKRAIIRKYDKTDYYFVQCVYNVYKYIIFLI